MIDRKRMRTWENPWEKELFGVKVFTGNSPLANVSYKNLVWQNIFAMENRHAYSPTMVRQNKSDIGDQSILS